MAATATITEVSAAQFVATENTQRILKSIHRAVKDRSWMLVHGDYGTGKSTLYHVATSAWQSEPRSYVVIEQPGLRLERSRTNALMARMIRALSPDERPPAMPEQRYLRLRTLLMQAYRAKKQVIIVSDFAQDMSETTLRELKKIHEIGGFGQSHLCSIIMFANMSARIVGVLRGQEIGYRVRQKRMDYLTHPEMEQFAKSFGLNFTEKKARNLFLERATPTPLGVRYFSDLAKDRYGARDLTFDGVKKILATTRKEELQSAGISYADVCDEYSRIYREGISKTSIMRAIEDPQKNTRLTKRLESLLPGMVREARSISG